MNEEEIREKIESIAQAGFVLAEKREELEAQLGALKVQELYGEFTRIFEAEGVTPQARLACVALLQGMEQMHYRPFWK